MNWLESLLRQYAPQIESCAIIVLILLAILCLFDLVEMYLADESTDDTQHQNEHLFGHLWL